MRFEPTAARLWKRLSRDERNAAATSFWKDTPAEVSGIALAAVVKARHMRPQVARSLPPEEQARALASVLDVGEPVASSLLVALHLGERRSMLATFLDAAGLPHENGAAEGRRRGGRGGRGIGEQGGRGAAGGRSHRPSRCGPT